MKDLPKVFEGKIDRSIRNTQDLYYGSENLRKDGSNNIIKKINSIFASSNHVYKSKVLIMFKDHEEEKVIVGKNSNSLITIDGELIKIVDIYDIKKIY